MVNANANVKKVDTILLKELKHCLLIKQKLLLILFVPFVLNIIAKLEIEN